MKVEHVPCGSFTNESESKLLEELKKKLQGLPGEGLWILLTNLAHSVGHNVFSDEIDIIALGASGIHIIEVKHWDSQYLKSNTTTVEHEAEKLNNKVKKVASKLRHQFDLGFIEGKMLLTKGEYKCVKGQQRQTIRGIKLFGLKEWHELLELDSLITLDTAFIRGVQKQMTHAIIFDEAHRASGLKLLPIMAKECRKYGILLIVASQEARDFNSSIFSAIANYLVFKLTESDAKAIAKNIAPSESVKQIVDRIKQMPKYQALFFCEGQRRPSHLTLKNIS